MRKGMLFLVVASLAGGTALCVPAAGAKAAPLPAFAAPNAASTAVVEPAAYWRRYWRRYCRWNYCGPDLVPPPVVVTPDDDAVAVVPLRPRSCGEFHYWNGVACVDARYNRPYLGPVW